MTRYFTLNVLFTVQLPVHHVLQRAEPLQQHLVADAGPLRCPVGPGPPPISRSLRAGGLDAARVAPGPEGHEPRDRQHVEQQ